MATTVLGTSKAIPAQYISGSTDAQSTQSKAVYTVTQTSTTTSVSVEVRYITGGYYRPYISGSVSATGQTTKKVSSAYTSAPSSYTTESKIATYTFSWTKTHSDQGNKTISVSLYPDKAGSSYASTLSFTVPVPAKTSYAVTYNNNGGGTAPAQQTKWYGEALTLQPAITNRTNYGFKNWNTKANGSGTTYAAKASYTGNSALTLYAQWNAPYTVKFNANGGSGSMSNQTIAYNSTTTKLTANSFARTNYSFDGWATTASGSMAYANQAAYTAKKSATLYARWKQVYASPSLKVTKALRVNSSGALDDEGTYALVTVQHSLYDTGSNGIKSSSVKVNGVTQSTVRSSTGNALSGTRTYLVNASMGTESGYAVTATLTDNAGGGTGKSSATSTAKGSITAAYFPLDILSGGHGIAFGKPATLEGTLESFYGGVLMRQANGVLQLSHGLESTESMLQAIRTDTGTRVGVGVGTGGVNHGVYSYQVNKWLVYADAARTYLNGACVDLVRTTTAADVIQFNTSNVGTVNAVQYVSWGHVAQLYMSWYFKSAIDVSISGNITNIEVGTLKDGKRPSINTAAKSSGDNAGQALYNISTDGVVKLAALEGRGVAYQITNSYSFQLFAIYII